MPSEVEIPKKSLYAIPLILIIIVAGIYYTSIYLPEQRAIEEQQQRQEEVQFAKKALYNSILCQQKCPLVEFNLEDQEFDNRTQIIADRECLNACITELNNKNVDTSKFADSEFLQDPLLANIDQVLRGCQEENFNNETQLVDRAAAMSCAETELENLKANYTYLN